MITIWGTISLQYYLNHYSSRLTPEHWSDITAQKVIEGDFIERWGAYLDWDYLAGRYIYVGDPAIVKYFHLIKTHIS